MKSYERIEKHILRPILLLICVIMLLLAIGTAASDSAFADQELSDDNLLQCATQW